MARKADKHAVLYFDINRGAEFKELAKRIRAENARTTLVWSSNFKDENSIIPEARAVIIQENCAFANRIAKAYRRFAHDVEIHFVDETGENFLEVTENEQYAPEPVRENLPSENPTLQTEAEATSVDPTDYGFDSEDVDGELDAPARDDGAISQSESDGSGLDSD